MQFGAAVAGSCQSPFNTLKALNPFDGVAAVVYMLKFLAPRDVILRVICFAKNF